MQRNLAQGFPVTGNGRSLSNASGYRSDFVRKIQPTRYFHKSSFSLRKTVVLHHNGIYPPHREEIEVLGCGQGSNDRPD